MGRSRREKAVLAYNAQGPPRCRDGPFRAGDVSLRSSGEPNDPEIKPSLIYSVGFCLPFSRNGHSPGATHRQGKRQNVCGVDARQRVFDGSRTSTVAVSTSIVQRLSGSGTLRSRCCASLYPSSSRFREGSTVLDNVPACSSAFSRSAALSASTVSMSPSECSTGLVYRRQFLKAPSNSAVMASSGP